MLDPEKLRTFAESVIHETEKDMDADAVDMVWQLDQWHKLITMLDSPKRRG